MKCVSGRIQRDVTMNILSSSCKVRDICVALKQINNDFNPLKTKRIPLYLKTQFVPPVNTFPVGYKTQSVYAVSSTSRCLFSEKYKTHKYSVDRKYNC